MKRIFTTLAMMLAVSLAFSQGYYYVPHINAGTNPGGLNTDAEYPVGGGLPSGWSTILTGSQSSPTWTSNQTIPFTFQFNGAAETQYKVSSSGVLTFTTSAGTAPSYTSTSLPNAGVPDKSVCIRGIAGTGSSDNIVTKTFGSAPNRQHWIFFSSYSGGGSSWTYWSIVLEETTNKIYIVDQRTYQTATGLSLGIQINSSSAVSVAGSPNVSAQATANDPSAADNSYYEFIPGSQPAFDMGGTGETMADYLITGQAPFTITGELTNFGTNTITSMDLNYSINGGTAVTASAPGSPSVATYATYNYSHPTSWTPPSAGTYTIDIWATNLNGNADGNTSNDKYTFQVEVVDTFVNRTTLLEVFTSSTCGPCAPGNAQMDNTVLPTISDYTVVKYQQNFPGSGDPYQTAEAVNRRGYYNINSIPRMEIDGQWDGNANSFTKSIFDSYQQQPAFLDFTINKAEYSGSTATIDFDVNPVVDINSGTYKVQTVIIENKTTGNVASNGETEFHNVMMDMIPNENGSAIGPFTGGTSVNVTKTSNLSSSNVEEMSDLKLVVWVEDVTTKTVLNSAWTDLTVPGGTGIEAIDDLGNGIMNMYPNPTSDITTVRYQTMSNGSVSINVMNTVGQVVLSDELGAQTDGVHYYRFDTQNMENGIYLVNVKIGERNYTKRLVVSK